MNEKYKKLRKRLIVNFIKRHINELEKTAEPIAIGYESWIIMFGDMPCTYGRFAKIYNSVKRGEVK